MKLTMLTILFFSIVLVSSCQKETQYPYYLEKGEIYYTEVKSPVFLEDLDANAHSELIMVEKHEEMLDYKIVVFDFKNQLHIHSENIWAEFKDLKTMDVDNDGHKEILYTFQKEDSLFLKIYNPISDKTILSPQKIVIGERRFKNQRWEGGFYIKNFADLNHDGFPDVILVVTANYDRYPRGMIAYDIKNRKKLWTFFCGPFIYNVQIHDLNSDGTLEIYFDTGSPGNGTIYPNRPGYPQTDDSHTYLIVLDENGKLLFQEELGRENSATNVIIARFSPNAREKLITVTKSGNAKNFDSKIIKWNWKTWPNFYPEIKSENLSLYISYSALSIAGIPYLLALNNENQICVFDSTLALVRKISSQDGFSGYSEAFDLTMDGKKEYVWYIKDNGALVFDLDLKPIFKFSNVSRIYEVKQGRTRQKIPALLTREGQLFTFTLKKKTIAKSIFDNRSLWGIPLLILVNIFILGYLALRAGNWKWYRRQLQHPDDSLAAVMLLDSKKRIIKCNKKCEQLLKKSLNENKKQTLNEVFRNQFQSLGIWANVAFDSKRNTQQEFSIRIDKQPHQIKAHLQSIRSRFGRLEGAVLILNDNTPMIRSQRAFSWITVAQKLAHEIKNPLTTIRLSLQRLKMEYEEDPQLQQRLEGLVEGSLGEVERLRSVVDDFMRFSKIDSAHPAAVDVSKIIHGLVERYTLRLPDSISITTDIPDKIPLVLADEAHLATVLSNLLDNALQAITPPGDIRIKINYIEKVNEEIENLMEYAIEIEISDTGHGMDEEDLQEIFKPFYTTKEDGSGLGLSIVKRIIDEHGGSIQIFSRREVGTRVTVQLPVA